MSEAIERALAAATAAREATAAIPPHERASVLNKAAVLAEERQEELARQMTLETGNAIWETRVEVRRTTEILRNAAEEARRVTGEVIPIDAWPNGTGREALTRRFPVGPVLAITPYNAPLLLVAHKLASAYAAGNPCIVRPARKTPLSALSLGELMVEAGALPDAVTVVPCSAELGERMVRDERIKMLSFTGSGEVGWHLRKVAATHRVALELGGNGAVIIHSDADLDHAAERCALGGFVRAGQACISVQRVFVAADVADAFEEKFVARVSELKLGDPLDDDTAIGVLVDEATTEKALALIADAKDGGATVVCGGGRRGPFVEPTLLRGAPEHARVSQVEAFAPIVSLQTYTDFDEALRGGRLDAVRAPGRPLHERCSPDLPRFRASGGRSADRQRRQHVPRRPHALRWREAIGRGPGRRSLRDPRDDGGAAARRRRALSRWPRTPASSSCSRSSDPPEWMSPSSG